MLNLNYADMEVTDIEYARYIILNLLKNTGVLIEVEKKENGVKTMTYKRLCKEFQAIKYVESLLIEQLRNLLD